MPSGGRPEGRDRQAGFTLVEMIVVLSLMAIMTGAVVLGLGAGTGGVQVETEARRLADRLRLAADETMVTDRALALDWDADGYGFVARDPDSGRWIADAQAELGPRHDLPSGLRLNGPGDLGPRLIAFDGTEPPLELRLSGNGAAWRISWDGLNADVEPEARA